MSETNKTLEGTGRCGCAPVVMPYCVQNMGWFIDKILGLRKDVDTLMDQIGALDPAAVEAQLAEFRTEIAAVQQQVAALDKEIDGFNLDQIKKDIDTLETEVVSHMQDINNLTKSQADQDTKIREMQASLTTAEGDIGTLRTDVNTASGLAQGADTKVTLLIPRVEALESKEISLDDTVTQGGTNGVKSSGIYQYGQSVLSSANAHAEAAADAVDAKVEESLITFGDRLQTAEETADSASKDAMDALADAAAASTAADNAQTTADRALTKVTVLRSANGNFIALLAKETFTELISASLEVSLNITGATVDDDPSAITINFPSRIMFDGPEPFTYLKTMQIVRFATIGESVLSFAAVAQWFFSSGPSGWGVQGMTLMPDALSVDQMNAIRTATTVVIS